MDKNFDGRPDAWFYYGQEPGAAGGSGGGMERPVAGEVDENFDQALGRHGVGTGPYVVWPVAGPSTVRGTFGMVADTLLKPFWFLGIGTVNFTSLGGGERVNKTALNLGAKEDIDQMAIDPYLGVRDLYFQHTQGKVRE